MAVGGVWQGDGSLLLKRTNFSFFQKICGFGAISGAGGGGDGAGGGDALRK